MRIKTLYPQPNEPITVFIYKYGRTHHLATGIRANRETHPSSIASFITAFELKLNRMVARKFAEAMYKLETLQNIFKMAEGGPRECWRLILMTDLTPCDSHPASMKYTMLK